MFYKVCSGIYKPQRCVMGKMILYSLSCHQPLKTFHTHTHTHTPHFDLATHFLNVLDPGRLFFSLWLFCVCYILLAFSPKHMLNIYTSLQLCRHHPSSSRSYLLSAFSNSLKRGSLPYSCYSPIEHWL